MNEVTAGTSAGRILVIDDDQELCELLVAYLQRENFSVECANDGAEGLRRALAEPFDVLILDVMLPSMPGFDVLRRVRQKMSLPVLMLSARGEEVDRIVGLELGADDYLPKPFNPRELVARLHAILRRAHTAPPPFDEPADPPLAAGDLRVDPSRREASFAAEPIALTTVEFDVLCILVRGAGTIVPRERISKLALGRPHSPFDRSVDMHVSNLRRKLQPLAGERVIIKTVRNAGYMLVASAASGGRS